MTDKAAMEALARLVPRGSRVLDLGCGNGAMLDYLQRERGCSGYGVEIADANVLACVQRGVQVVAVVQKGRELRVVRPAAQADHHGLRHLHGHRGATQVGDAVQQQIDAGGDARAGVDGAIGHEHAVGRHVAARPGAGGAWWRAGR